MRNKRDSEKCKKNKKCECGVEIRGFGHKKYCSDCAKKRHNEVSRKYMARKQAVVEKPSIDLKWLKRGLK